jgi:anti-sigma factor RsiW
LAGCEDIQPISAYHDGELPPADAQAVARHIAQCPSCRTELERLQAISKWLSAAPQPAIPPAAVDRLRRSVRPRRDRLVLRTTKALTAAAAAVLLVCAGALWRGRQAGAGPIQRRADWETAAVMPASVGLAASASGADVEDNGDVELARSILGSFSAEGGYGRE